MTILHTFAAEQEHVLGDECKIARDGTPSACEIDESLYEKFDTLPTFLEKTFPPEEEPPVIMTMPPAEEEPPVVMTIPPAP